MACPQCGFQSPAGMRFCGACGTPLPSGCPECGFENPAGFRFCGQCGTALTAGPPGGPPSTSEAAPPAAPPSGPPAAVASPAGGTEPSPADAGGERRLLTVMFCDLADYTGLSEVLDPEELQDVVRRFQGVCIEIIERYEGHVAQLLGDGILVYFGFPVAHEDDARRAVHAGLQIAHAVERSSRQIDPYTDRHEAVRVGIHTGPVVTGEMGAGGRRERLALGRTPNVAARLEGLAEPGQVLISDATRSLLGRRFELESLGPRKLKGVSDPVTVHLVLGERDAGHPFEMADEGAATPLVGRDGEVAQLDRLWARVSRGEGQIVLLVGEAGVGKSRLMRAFRDRLRRTDHHFLWAQASSVGDATMLGPVIEMLGRTFDFRPSDTSEERLPRLERALKVYGLDLDRHVPLFASLLEIPLPARYPEPDMTPQLRKQRTLEAIARLMERMAAEQPVLMVLEDLHWVDPSTQELLDLLVAQSPTQPMLTALTSRPGFTPRWGNRSYLTLVNLHSLGQDEAGEMIQRVAGGKPLPPRVVEEIVSRTDGVPLFVEELTKAVLQSGILTEEEGRYVLTGDLRSLSIPTTIQGSLIARLDALERGKEVAQVAATIGREFGYGLLAEVSGLDEEALQAGLAELIEAEFLYQRGVPPHASYVFKHAMIQDTAAASLLRRRSQRVHMDIARALERRTSGERIPLPWAPAEAPAGTGADGPVAFSDTVETTPERLAHHYTEAGAVEEAVDWWLRAATRALERSANLEALKHVERGLALVDDLPEGPLARRREQALHGARAPALVATRGYGDAAVQEAYGRVLALCSRDDDRELFMAHLGLWMFSVVRADFPAALEHADEMMRAAEGEGDVSLLVEARFAMGLTRYFMGEPAEALAHLRRAVEADDPDRDRSITLRTGQDAGVCALAYEALALWMLGRDEEAVERSRRAEALARELEHPFSLVYALYFRCWLNLGMGDHGAARRHAEEVVRLSEEAGFFWVTLGSVALGRAMAEDGEVEDGLATIREGLAGYRAPGARLSETLQLALEAETCALAGDPGTALERLAEARRAAGETRERFWEAELHRLEGLVLEESDPDAAEDCYRTALRLAEEQGAVGHARRCRASLEALGGERGRAEAAPRP